MWKKKNLYTSVIWIAILMFTLVLSSCKSTKNKSTIEWKYNDASWGGFESTEEYDTKNIPEGFVLINGGTYTSGLVDGYDKQIITPMRVTISSYLIGKYEVTNREYREFVHWVRDSIAHAKLDHYLPPDSNMVSKVDFSQSIDWSAEEVQFLFKKNDQSNRKLHVAVLMYNGINIYPDTTVWEKDFPEQYDEKWAKSYFSSPRYDNYPVVGVNYNQAIAYCNWKTYDLNKNRPKAIWYPTVRLPTETEWEYAALALEGTKKRENELLYDRKIFPWIGSFYAPTRRTQSSIHCNSGGFRDTKYNQTVIDFDDDGYLYTAPVDAYRPNNWGLYQMAGNVSEWILGSYRSQGIEPNIRTYSEVVKIYKDEGYDIPDSTFWKATATIKYFWHNYSFFDQTDFTLRDALSLINQIENPTQLHKLTSPYLYDSEDESTATKGGSWLDMPYYMQVGIRKPENPNNKKATIGFRTAMPLGAYLTESP